MQMHGSINKSPIKLSLQWKINNTVICLRMGKTNTAKTPPGDFKITTPEIPLLSQQAVTCKGILVPYTNLQLNPYPICDFNHQLEKVVGCKVLQFIYTMKIKKMLGHKTLWCKIGRASCRERVCR